MSQRSTSPPARRAAYRARVRAAAQRRSGPTPPPRRTASKSAVPKPVSPQDKRRMLQLLFSGMVLVVAIAVKLLMPDVLDRYRTRLLDLLGADTDFVEVFSAAGRAFSEEGAIGGALNDAYTAVFGPSVPSEAPAQTAVYTPDVQPANTDLLQQVLGFAYAPPVAGQFSSGFGLRTDPLAGGSRFHYGLDIAAEEGAVVSAFAAGTVTAVGESSDLGRYVTVYHPNGYSTLYAHCTRITASAGQQVSCGDPIAEVGETGRATGPHLHFELHRGSTYLNPIYYVSFQ